MTPFMRELIPLLFLFLVGLVVSGSRLWHSMHVWFSKTGSDEYIAYSLDWYLVTPIIFAVGWYGGVFLVIAAINLWASFNR